jgi:hypothetical protein
MVLQMLSLKVIVSTLLLVLSVTVRVPELKPPSVNSHSQSL